MKYLLESTVCVTIFYGLYYLIFRRLTFVRLNRIYLLSSLVIGLSLPLISYQIKEVVKIPASVEYEETNSMLLVMNNSTPLMSNIPIEKSFDWNMILQRIYLLGIAIMFFKLIYSFRLIVKEIILKSSNLTNSRFEKEYISTQSKYANSSFFNLIFINDSNLSVAEINQILAHEKWHIRLFHSYDLLFVELLKIIFWFNPILWLYQRSLSEVHEYEVDTRMIQAYNPQIYAQLLLKLATPTPQLATTHQFSRKPLTDRIHFLFTKQKSVPMKRLAYLSVLPILGAFFMAFSVEKVVDYQVEDKPDEKYFKVIKKPDADVNNEVQVRNNKVISSLIYGKNKVALSITPNDVSEGKALEEAAKYFKNIGFNLEMTHFEFRNNKKELSKIELTLTEDNENKKKFRSKKTDIKSDLPSKFMFDLQKMKRRGLDDIITIFADRSTGEHFVAPLAPPPPPPPPPTKMPPVPPKPPLPIKLGMNNLNGKTHKWDKNKIVNFSKIMRNMLEKSSEIVVEGQKIGNGLYVSKSITQREWQVFLDYINNDKYFSSEFKRKMIPDNWSKINVKSDKLPVTFVSFEQASEYCNWKSKLLNYEANNNYKVDYITMITSKMKSKRPLKFRLPTEKEWQIASKKKIVNESNGQICFFTVVEIPAI